jgi:glycosyltransferase involved in cell wall biosynthesis
MRSESAQPPLKVVLFANTDWYLYNFRLALAQAIQSAGVEVVMISPPGPFAHRFHELGLRWVPVNMSRRGFNPMKESVAMLSLIIAIRREAPDLIHCFTVKGVIFGALAARVAGVPLRINALTGLGYVFASQRWAARLLRPVVTYLLRLVLRGRRSRLIVQNPNDRDELVRQGIVTGENTVLIRGSGVNVSAFEPVERNGRIKLRVLMATRMLWSKGVHEYITAAALVRLSHPHIEFLMAGDPDPGNPASVPEEVIRQWRDAGIVNYLGHVESMSALLRDVDVVVLPTVYGEGVPRILVEAAAAGVPIIASNVPGCREIVEQGVNGLLIPPRSAEALAAAIYDLCGDEGRRVRMGESGRKLAVQEFDERLVIHRTLEVYRELLPTFPNAPEAASVAGTYGIQDFLTH